MVLCAILEEQRVSQCQAASRDLYMTGIDGVTLGQVYAQYHSLVDMHYAKLPKTEQVMPAYSQILRVCMRLAQQGLLTSMCTSHTLDVSCVTHLTRPTRAMASASTSNGKS
jgi:hypothetical protein